MCMATTPTTLAQAHGHGMMLPCRSQQDISTAFNILSESESPEYPYSIIIFEDIWFVWNSRLIPSLTRQYESLTL